jgi:hypothetical protein
LRFLIVGEAPLLMHNGAMIDPLNPFAKGVAAAAAKRRKTEADHEHIARLEFLGGLYLRDGAPCLPGEMMEAALAKAAALKRRGASAKAGLLVRENAMLAYEGPRDPSDLWADPSFRFRVPVRIGASRLMRTRPIFRTWAAEVTVEFLPGLLNARDVRDFLVMAGEQIGIGDYRPKFGRFRVEDLTPAIKAAA